MTSAAAPDAVKSKLPGSSTKRTRPSPLIVAPLSGDQGLTREKTLYMENLKKLHIALPALHVHLRMMQTRLGRNRHHMSAVSGWLSASRDVL